MSSGISPSSPYPSSSDYHPSHTEHEFLLTDDDLAIVSLIKSIGSILTIIGTLFIIIVYLYLSYKIRDNKDRKPSITSSSKTKTSQITDDKTTNPHGHFKKLKLGFGHNLIFFLALSDFLYGIATFIKTKGFNHYYVDFHLVDASCVAQGFLINFSELSSICWTSMISLAIYLGTFADITKIPKIYFYFFIYSYGVPLILAIGPLFTESYGSAGAWCWMNTEDLGNYAAWVWALIIYIFSWLNIAFNLFAVIKTIYYFKIRAFEVYEEGNKQEYNFLKNFCIVLKFFPIILIICWFFPTINRIYTFISHKQNLVLFSLHIFFSSCTGFFNSIVYSYYYKNFIPCLRCYNGKEEKSDVEEINDIKKENINPEKNNENKQYIKNVTEIEIDDRASSFDSNREKNNNSINN